MTVCIAALYEDGKGTVLVSDQMVTAHIPIGYEYEHGDVTKIIAVDETCSIYALVAGDVLRGNEIIIQSKVALGLQQGQPAASDLAELVRKAYQKIRLTTVIHRELEPRGLGLDEFYGRHQSLAQQVVQMIDQALHQYDIGVQILIAGVNGPSHSIHTIVNPGVTMDNTAIGHGAIGSGAPHALASMIEDGYSPSLEREKVKGMICRAKKRSEVAPGVGTKTTTLILPKDD